MKRAYPTILTKTKDLILVEVPDLEIVTEGKDLGDAIEMARDAIGISGISMQDRGDDIPEPSEIGTINILNGSFASDGEGILTLVDIDFDAYRREIDQKMVRRNVTLPSWLNTAANKAHLNVSRVLQDALKESLGL